MNEMEATQLKCAQNIYYGYKAKKVKGKGKDHPRTGHENPEGEKNYSSTLLSTSALGEGLGVRHAPADLPP